MATFLTSGSDIVDTKGNKVVLRGVNLPLLDDFDFPGGDKLADLETSGANCVRVQWYVSYPNPRPHFGLADLDDFLGRCKQLRILPILGLWDLTCNGDVDLVNTKLVLWWTDPAVVAVLNAHEDYLIVNLANELGVFHWSDDATRALTAFRDAYINAVASVRAAGLKVPVMIDAPDCGTSLDAFTIRLDPMASVGQQLIDADPLHNIVFSAHAYWAGEDRAAAAHDMVAANFPLVMGEIANKQAECVEDATGGLCPDDGCPPGTCHTDECHYGLDGTGVNAPAPSGFQYQTFLTKLLELNVGWLAWSWHPDGCPARNIAEYDAAGAFTGLTPYGDDIVNNPTYGLKATAVRF